MRMTSATEHSKTPKHYSPQEDLERSKYRQTTDIIDEYLGGVKAHFLMYGSHVRGLGSPTKFTI